MRRRSTVVAAATLLLLAGCAGGSDDACTALEPDPPGGEYAVGDAGTVTVTQEADRLVLGGVQPADGWTHEVTGESATEVEVEFTRPGEEVDVDVEIEDGALDAEYCRSDG